MFYLSTPKANSSNSEELFREVIQCGRIPHYKVDNSRVVEQNYTFGTKLGEGTFGVVMAALNNKDRSKVAIKQIFKLIEEKDNDIGGVVATPGKSWMHEIRILSMVKHVNIVSLYEIIESDQHVFLIMELCDGGTLQKVLNERGLFAELQAKEFMIELSSALAYLHGKNIVHRDLKLDNLLLQTYSQQVASSSKRLTFKTSDDSSSSHGKEFSLKLADFGLSVELKKVEDTMIEFCGTPLYMAPEIVNGRSYSKQCDVWSMGIIMHLLLTGKTPFHGISHNMSHDKNLSQIYQNIREWKEFKIEKSSNITITPRAQSLLKHLLDPDPAYRFTASEIINDPWITGSELANNTQQTNVLKLLKQFNSGSAIFSTDDNSTEQAGVDDRSERRSQTNDKIAPRRTSVSAGNKPRLSAGKQEIKKPSSGTAQKKEGTFLQTKVPTGRTNYSSSTISSRGAGTNSPSMSNININNNNNNARRKQT